MSADRFNLPAGTWTCRCTREGTRYHAAGVKLCFLCGAVNPAPRVARPVAATATNGGPSANDTPISRSPGRPAPKTAKQGSAVCQPTATRQPNQAEAEWLRLMPGCGDYEAACVAICGGATYTPDFANLERKIGVEVKGEYIHSRDSRRRFDEAKHLNPDWTWIWARKRSTGRKGPRWEIEIYPATKGEQA